MIIPKKIEIPTEIWYNKFTAKITNSEEFQWNMTVADRQATQTSPSSKKAHQNQGRDYFKDKYLCYGWDSMFDETVKNGYKWSFKRNVILFPKKRS